MRNLVRRREPGEDAFQAVLYRERVHLLYRQQPLALVGSLGVAGLVAAVVWNSLPQPALLIWLAGFATLTLARIGALLIFWRVPEERRTDRFWYQVHLWGTGLAGLTNGAVGLLALTGDDPHALHFIIVVLCGLGAFSLSINGPSAAALQAYILPLMLPTGLGLLLVQSSAIELALGILMWVFAVNLVLMGLRYHQVLVDAWRLRFDNHALYRRTLAANRQARESAQAQQAEMDQREQAERHLAAYAQRLQQANAALQREIADRERNERLLTQQALSILESEVQVRAMFQNAFDAILTCAEDGAIVSSNPAAQALFGYSETALEKQSIQTLIPAFHQLATPRQVVEAEGVSAAGRRIPLAFSMDRMRVGRQAQYVCILRDQTQAHQAREALIRAKEAAETANRAKSEFLSSMSHELRTPLNAILGFTQLLQSDPTEPLSDDQRESLDQIAQAGWHLLRLINDVLDLAKVEAGRLETDLQDVPLADVLQESLGLVLPDAERCQIILEDRCGATRLVLRADYLRLKQVLLNLLSNAIKYNRDGGKVIIEAPVTERGRCRLTIADTGRGLTTEQIALIFSPFARVAEDRRAIEGTGIGLSITQKLLALMDGQIGVASEPGVGSRFWIELPLADGTPAPPSAPEAAPATPPTAGAEPPGDRLVLYVEDNPANLYLVRSLIRRHRPRIELLSAGDGPQGLELTRARRPDLILVDIALPGMSGFELLAALRAAPLTQAIPAIALSANAMPEDIDRGLAAGFADYLVKPLDMPRFLAILDRLLEGP